jgi:uncharacterized membrane protein YfcA
MLTARSVLYSVLVLVNLAAIIGWIAIARQRQLRERPSLTDCTIGCATCFLDTLGIGSYAQITALFKLRKRPPDELIPGTLNVGSAVPVFISSLFYFGAVAVDPTLLASMVISSGLGAWLGARIVSHMPRRSIQIVMGLALLVAAAFLAVSALGILPPSGNAFTLSGWRFALAVLANLVLGLLGMHPLAAYPIMIGSDGVLIPVATLGFLRSGRFSHGCALGITLGGVLGVLAALPLVRLISGHLTLMRWFVIVVVLYAAVSMLRSARASRSLTPIA